MEVKTDKKKKEELLELKSFIRNFWSNELVENGFGVHRSDTEIDKILKDKRERIKQLESELEQPVTEKVIEDLKERSRIGEKKYGTVLKTNNGRKALQDAYEEVLDLAQYLKQKLMEEEG